jgi:hypothetical protein
MPLWLGYSLVTIALFGCWGLVSTVVTNSVGFDLIEVAATMLALTAGLALSIEGKPGAAVPVPAPPEA